MWQHPEVQSINQAANSVELLLVAENQTY